MQQKQKELKFPCWLRVGDNRQRYFKNREEFEKAIKPRPELHYVQGDRMEPCQHPCNGKYYDSLSQFRQVTHDHGCVEIAGTNLNPGQKPLDISEYEIGKGIHDEMERRGVTHKDMARDLIKIKEATDNGYTGE